MVSQPLFFDRSVLIETVNGVELRVMRTEEPWAMGFDAITIPAGPRGGLRGGFAQAFWKVLGRMGDQVKADLTIAIRDVDFGVTKPAALDVERFAPDTDLYELRHLFAATAFSGKGPSPEGAGRAAGAVVRLANKFDIRHLAIALMGTGDSRGNSIETAQAMAEAVREALSESSYVLQSVTLTTLAPRVVEVLTSIQSQTTSKVGADTSTDAKQDLLSKEVLIKPSGPAGVGTTLGDRPTFEDTLGREGLVNALSEMIAHEHQRTPLTLALLGDWGAGKSSVMKQIERNLRLRKDRRFAFAWFDAWGYEQSDNIVAGLAQEVVKGIAKAAGFWGCLWLRLQYAIRLHTWVFVKASIALLITVILGGMTYFFMPDEPSTTPRSILSEDAPQEPSEEQANNNEGQEQAGEGGAELSALERGILSGIFGTGTIGVFMLFLLYSKNRLIPILQHPLATELATYLKLPDYGEHLGVIPVMRRDLEALWACYSRRPTPAKREKQEVAAMLRADPLAAGRDEPGDNMPRLLVFIDDLDRCRPKAINQTLDAIRLVMDIPGVVVIVAVDPGVMLKAVHEDHKDRCRDYLGKIIQVPVHLMEPPSDGLERLITKDLFDRIGESGGTIVVGSDAIVERVEGRDEPVDGEGGRDDGRTPASITPPSTEGQPDDSSGPSSADRDRSDADSSLPEGDPQKVELEKQARREVMEDTKDERDLFLDLAKALNYTNPRTLIRLRNSFRLLKAIAYESQSLAKGDRESGEGETKTQVTTTRLMLLMFLADWVLDHDELSENARDGLTGKVPKIGPALKAIRSDVEAFPGLVETIDDICKRNALDGCNHMEEHEPTEQLRLVLRLMLPHVTLDKVPQTIKNKGLSKAKALSRGGHNDLTTFPTAHLF